MGIELFIEPEKKRENTATLRRFVVESDFSSLTLDQHLQIVNALQTTFPNYCSGASEQLVLQAKKYFSSISEQNPTMPAYNDWLKFEERLYAESPCQKCLLATKK